MRPRGKTVHGLWYSDPSVMGRGECCIIKTTMRRVWGMALSSPCPAITALFLEPALPLARKPLWKRNPQVFKLPSAVWTTDSSITSSTASKPSGFGCLSSLSYLSGLHLVKGEVFILEQLIWPNRDVSGRWLSCSFDDIWGPNVQMAMLDGLNYILTFWLQRTVFNGCDSKPIEIHFIDLTWLWTRANMS